MGLIVETRDQPGLLITTRPDTGVTMATPASSLVAPCNRSGRTHARKLDLSARCEEGLRRLRRPSADRRKRYGRFFWC